MITITLSVAFFRRNDAEEFLATLRKTCGPFKWRCGRTEEVVFCQRGKDRGFSSTWKLERGRADADIFHGIDAITLAMIAEAISQRFGHIVAMTVTTPP